MHDPAADPLSAPRLDPERRRLAKGRAGRVRWDLWGPYLAERQWGTVREDYSARRRRLGLLPPRPCPLARLPLGRGRAARHQRRPGRLCFALALWNGHDPILKERLFGLTGPRRQPRRGRQGGLLLPRRHADPQLHAGALQISAGGVPLRRAGRRKPPPRTRDEPEYELLDTGVFAEDRYFDVVVEYAKAAPDDILIRISATNRGPERATLHLLPTLWFRNTGPGAATIDRARSCAPHQQQERRTTRLPTGARQPRPLGDYWLACAGAPELLFTENETNTQRLWGVPNASPYVKDGIDDAIVQRRAEAVNPERRRHEGRRPLPARARAAARAETILLRLRSDRRRLAAGRSLRRLRRRSFAARQREADAFYAPLAAGLDADDAARSSARRYAGLLWSKQFYHFDVAHWLDGDPAGPPPPAAAQARPQRRLAPPQQRRRHSRCPIPGSTPGTRPGISPSTASPLALHRPRLRQAAAGPAPARVVHASQRPAAGLRVGIRRRQPAGARLGRLAGLPDRRRRPAATPTAPSWSASSTS